MKMPSNIVRSPRVLLATLTFVLAPTTTAQGDEGAKPPQAQKITKEAAEEAAAALRAKDPAIRAIQEFIAMERVAKLKQKDGWRTMLPKPPKVGFAAATVYHWKLKTNKGDIDVELLPNVAPMHVSSTIYLTELRYYDGLGFHRVITNFMAQGGCPNTAEGAAGRPGTGGPGYQYAGEFDKLVRHDRPGLLSMANSGAGTDGSQFFLTFKATPWLDGRHTIFGEVVDGTDVLRKLEQLGSPSGQTKERLAIKTARILVY